MATSPLSSETQQPSSSTIEQEICLSFHEAITYLPEFLQSDDEQEQNELAMFLYQVDQLHKPVDSGKISARHIFNYLQHMLKPVTHSIEGVSQVTLSEQLPQLTGIIATEVASSVINNVDLYNTTISILNVLQDFSWETKAVLVITTFALTFGDNGLNLCQGSNISVNEIKLFAKLKKGFNNQLEHNNNLFAVVLEIIGSIVEFEILSMTYMKSKDPKVKVERTHLIVAIYWIIRIIVAGGTSHLMKKSRRGNEFDKTFSILLELLPRWSKKLKDLADSGHLTAKLLDLKDILKEDIDIEAYNNLKRIVQQEYHSDNMEVLNALVSSASEDVPTLYNCFHKRKVHHHDLKGGHVLLFISGLENIAPEVDEAKLNKFIDNFDGKREILVDCKILWIPIVDHSQLRTKVTKTSIMKPFLEWYYSVRSMKLLEIEEEERNFKGWYSIDDPSKVSNEVKRLIRDDWNYIGEPMILVLDPQGRVVHLNAIYMFYIWGIKAFPFTSKREEYLWKDYYKRSFYFLRKFLMDQVIIGHIGLGDLYVDWLVRDELFLIYGGEGIEWIRNFTGTFREVWSGPEIPIRMIYVGRSHNQELVRRVEEENLSHCVSHPISLWLFWKRLESAIHSLVQQSQPYEEGLQQLQRLLNYDKQNVGWACIQDFDDVWLGKVALSTLNELKLKSYYSYYSRGQLKSDLKTQYGEQCRKINPCLCLEFPTTGNKDYIIKRCPDCDEPMEQYTSFVCYHARPTA